MRSVARSYIPQRSRHAVSTWRTLLAVASLQRAARPSWARSPLTKSAISRLRSRGSSASSLRATTQVMKSHTMRLSRIMA